MATKQKRNQPKPKPQGKKPAAKKPPPKSRRQSRRKKAAAKPPKPARKKSRRQSSSPQSRAKSRRQRQRQNRPPRVADAVGFTNPVIAERLQAALSRSTPPPSAASPTDGGVRYLSVQDLVELHRAVSAEFGGNQAHPGVVESQFGLVNAVQRPQVTTLGREAYPTFPDKVAAFLFALLSTARSAAATAAWRWRRSSPSAS